MVASYDEVKRSIRSGEVPPDQPLPDADVRAAPKLLDEIFRLAGHESVAEPADRVAREDERVGAAGLSPTETAVLDVWWLEAEVNDGGFAPPNAARSAREPARIRSCGSS